MKLTFILMFAALFSVSARGFGQGASLSIKMEDASLKEVLTELKNSTSFSYVYNEEAIAEVDEVNISAENASVQEILEECLNNTELTYHMENNVIIIHKRPYEELVSTVKQEKYEIRGTVIDDQKIPLPGVSVVVKGTNIGTATDIDGNYVLKVDQKPTALVFTFVGMNQQEIAYTGQKVINVTLSADNEALEEVVVTGFQVISKERSSGSFTKVKAEDIEKPVLDLTKTLEGAVTGLEVREDGNIVLRGINSAGINNMLKHKQKPLIVVDGFPVDTDLEDINPDDIANMTVLKDAAAASIWGARSANGVIVITTKKAKKSSVEVHSFVSWRPKPNMDKRLNRLSSDETIKYKEYLWGASDANGRRYIYPKGHSKAGVTTFAKGIIDETLNEFHLNNISKAEKDVILNKYRNLDNADQIKKYLMNDYFVHQHNVAISSASEKSNHRLSLNFRDVTEQIKGNENNKYGVNYNSTFKLAKWLDFNFNSAFNYEDKDYSGDRSTYDSQIYGVFDATTQLAPYYMLKDENGNLVKGDFSQNGLNRYMVDKYYDLSQFPYEDMSYNPIQELNSRDFNKKRLTARFQAGLDVKLSKAFKYSTKFQYQFLNIDHEERFGEESFITRQKVNEAVSMKDGKLVANLPKGQMVHMFGSKVRSYNFRNQLDFNKSFGDKHRVSAILGMEFSKSITKHLYHPTYFGYDKDKNQFGIPPNGFGISKDGAIYSHLYSSYWGGPKQIRSSNISVPGIMYGNWVDGYNSIPARGINTDVYFSTYFNAAYTYNDKYTVTMSARADASNFVSENTRDKFSPFWSVGTNWQIGREDFMSGFDWIDMLAIRASYGFNGNANKNSGAKTLLTVNAARDLNTGEYLASVERGSYGNPDLTWEKVGTFNFAIDYSLMRGKLSGKLEYYSKQSRDLLGTIRSPFSVGTTEVVKNALEMSNKGIEIEISSRLPITKKLSWDGTIALNYNKNKVTKYLSEPAYANALVYSGIVQGKDVSALYTYKFAGVNEDGTPLILGTDGNTYDITNWQTTKNLPFIYSHYKGVKTAPYIARFSTGLTYGNFRLSATLTGKFGHKFMRSNSGPSTYPSNYRLQKPVGDYFYGDPNKVPVVSFDKYYPKLGNWSNVFRYTDYYLANAGHIRIQDINLSYNLPKKMIEKWGLSNCKIYSTAYNVGTILFNKYDEDPERKFKIDKPTFTLGVKCSF